MNTFEPRLRELLDLHARNALTPEQHEELSDLLARHWRQLDPHAPTGNTDWHKMMSDIIASDRSPTSRKVSFLRPAVLRYAAAAAVLILLAGTYWLHLPHTAPPAVAVNESPRPVAREVMPGSDKAVLTISDGKRIELSAQENQVIADGNLSITNKNGLLSYRPSNISLRNTMTTPRGGQYKLSLPDGSKVWLNAASSITFPTSFSRHSREVEITGEVYFEISRDAGKPFIVNTGKNLITVLGTQFNVNSYDDEPSAKISLLEGSVRVDKIILQPDEAYTDGRVVKTNPDQDVAWKDGVFSFDKTRIDAVMRQLSRWYNVSVAYPDGVPALMLSGSMGRDLNLSQTLQGLKVLGVNAVLENNTLIVKPS